MNPSFRCDCAVCAENFIRDALRGLKGPVSARRARRLIRARAMLKRWFWCGRLTGPRIDTLRLCGNSALDAAWDAIRGSKPYFDAKLSPGYGPIADRRLPAKDPR